MSLRSALACFFRPDPHNAHIGPPGAQGMILVNREPAKLNLVPRPERIRHERMKTAGEIAIEEAARQKALGPRTWRILCGTGEQIGTAFEDPVSKVIIVTWTADPFPGIENATYCTRWVDEAAFLADMHDNRYGRFPSNSRFVQPLRVHRIPRTPEEAAVDKFTASLEDFDG